MSRQTVTGVTARGEFYSTPPIWRMAAARLDHRAADCHLHRRLLASALAERHPWNPALSAGCIGTSNGPAPAAYWKSTTPTAFMAMEETLSYRRTTPGYGGSVGRPVARLRCAHEGGDCRNTPESMVAVPVHRPDLELPAPDGACCSWIGFLKDARITRHGQQKACLLPRCPRQN